MPAKKTKAPRGGNDYEDEDEEDLEDEELEEEEDDGSDLPDKEVVLEAVTDLVSDLLVYDRKDDEDLPKGAIQEMIDKELITIEEIVERFREELEEQLA